MKQSPAMLTISVVCTILSIVFVLTTNGRTSNGCVSASGIVFMDDNPLTGADLFLVPVESTTQTKSYHGRTDSSGQYEVAGGLPPGEYRVVVRHFAGAQPSTSGGVTYQPGEIDEGQMAAMMDAAETREQMASKNKATAKSQLPEFYSSAQLTPLRVLIPDSGASNADLHLTNSEGSRVASGHGGSNAIR